MIHFQSNGGLTPEEKEFSSKNMNINAAETQGSLSSGNITAGLSTDNGDSARRAKVKQRKIPNYLRPSTGSCHDICKYGTRHAFEGQPNIPPRKRFTKPEDTFIQILVENVDSKGHSSKPTPRPNASSTNKPTSSQVVTRETLLPQHSIDDKKMLSSGQKSFDQMVKSKPPVKLNSSNGVHGKGRRGGGLQKAGKAKASASANKAAPAPLVPKPSISKTASNKTRQSGRVKSSYPGKDQHISNNQVSKKTLHVINTGTGNDPSESTPQNNGIPALESPSSPVFLSQLNPSMADEVNGADEFADNKSMIMETNTTESAPTLGCHLTPALPSASSLKSSSHRRSPSSSSLSPKPSSHKISPSSSSLSPKPSSHKRSPSSSSLSSKSSSHKRSPSSSSLSSKSSSHKRSPSSSSLSSKSSSHRRSPSSSSLEEDEGIKHIAKETNKPVSGKRSTVKISKATQPPKGNLNKNPRKIKVVSNDDKHNNRPVKLKFKSGKVVDLDQDNNKSNNIPRRLKFRRTRVNGDKSEMSVSHRKKSVEIGNIHSVKENSKTLRKSRVVVSAYKRGSPMRLFRGTEKGSSLQGDSNVPLRLRFRRGRIIGGDEGKGDSKRIIRNGGVEGASLKMKLKHQDPRGKKDDQRLFNNVIEETATKLAESRKSKVKALVGAFETVISLHSPRA